MLNVKEIIRATNGNLVNGNEEYIPQNYVIDSRLSEKGDFFVPIVGEKVDGHKYILECVKSGICGYYINSNLYNKQEIVDESIKINKDIIIIEVEDTEKALINSAMFNREKHIDIPVIAVTGSVGKTSTREIIASVLSTEKNVLVTEKNYNSLIGLPIMCLKIDKQDVCVLEVGIDKFEEMDMLSKIVKPDVVCFTIIGTSHIGTFKTRDTIFEEKFKLVNELRGIKKIIINGDDDKLALVDTNKYDIIKIFEQDISNIKVFEDKLKYTAKIYGKENDVELNQIGLHNAKNSLFAIKVGEIFGISEKNIINGISNYKNFNNRLNYFVINTIKIIDDTYNASFESLKAGIETINTLDARRKIAVLGDVFDLGDKSIETHENIGKYLLTEKLDLILLSGKAMKTTYDIIKDKINCIYFENKEDIVDYLISNIESDTLIYFKASNGMKFIDIVNNLKENLNIMQS